MAAPLPPLDADAWPHAATLYPSSYPMAPGGGSPRLDGQPVACPCNAQLPSAEKLQPADRGASQAVGSRTTYDVTLPADTLSAPQLAAARAIAAGDRVDLAVSGLTLVAVAVAPAAPAFAGRWLRLRVAIEA